jgi:hypothetical protein
MFFHPTGTELAHELESYRPPTILTSLQNFGRLRHTSTISTTILKGKKEREQFKNICFLTGRCESTKMYANAYKS